MMTATTRTVDYQVTLNTLTGPREISGTATVTGHLTDRQISAAVGQHSQAGTGTPVQAVRLHNAN